jgi:minor extracellular protease Epr
MRSSLASIKKGFVFLLALAGGVLSLGNPAVLAQGQAARGNDAAARAQQRAGDAIERAAAAQERSAAATERAMVAQGRAGDATQRALDASARGSERSALAREQIGNRAGPDRPQDYRRWRPNSSVKPIDLAGAYLALVRANTEALEIVGEHAAVRGQIVAIDPDSTAIDALTRLGYRPVSRDVVDGLGFEITTLSVPSGKTVEQALLEVRGLKLGTEFAPNDLFLQSGAAEAPPTSSALAPSVPINGPAIGVIDGGVAATPFVLLLMQKGFAAGAPLADPHATALATLAAGKGKIASAAPHAPLYVADIFGNDPRGGNALAVAKALGWMAQLDVPVVVIGLVGPDNPVLRRAVASARAKGIMIVAPVGNAGAAAPPLYPAAYSTVIGVTGVDRRNRALVEAGRGPHVHFAAPGAGIVAAAAYDRLVRVRGTSFAAPLVAGRLWLLRDKRDPVASLEEEALDLGALGRDPVFGAGLVCGRCR